MQHTALRARLARAGRTRVRVAPVQRLGIGMHPEETFMSPIAVSLADGLARILEQILADHRLRDSVNNAWVC